MDDFGTGYSSLNTLRALPFNTVKLDRAFVSDSTDNQRGQIVARNTIVLAKQLGMRIIAEGVETVEQALFLRNMGCDQAQGFYYSRPMDAREFETFSFVHRKCFWVDPRFRTASPTGKATRPRISKPRRYAPGLPTGGGSAKKLQGSLLS